MRPWRSGNEVTVKYTEQLLSTLQTKIPERTREAIGDALFQQCGQISSSYNMVKAHVQWHKMYFHAGNFSEQELKDIFSRI